MMEVWKWHKVAYLDVRSLTSRLSYDAWLKEVKERKLNAIESFVLWEKTVAANDLRNKAVEVAMKYFEAKEWKTKGMHPPP